MKFVWCEQDPICIIRCYPLFIIWPPGQSISLVDLARLRDNLVGKCRQEERPAGLTMSQGLLRGKVAEVGMVGKNFGHVRAPLEVVTEVTQGKDDCQKFFIVDFVVPLCRL